MAPEGAHVTAATVARWIGRDRRTIVAWIGKGVMRGMRIGRCWYVMRCDAEALRDMRGSTWHAQRTSRPQT